MSKRKVVMSLFFILIGIVGCCQQKVNKKEAITEFYKEYINEVSKMPIDIERLDSLKKTICTEKCYNAIKGLDYDPFLSAQDIDDDISNTLTIKQDKIDENRILVTYVDSYTKEIKKIMLTVVLNNNKVRINSIK